METTLEKNDLVFTAMGLVSALGNDVYNAAAAARAGITRTDDLPYFKFKSADDGEIEVARGHQVPIGTFGFEGQARLLILLRMGLENLNRRFTIKGLNASKTQFYLSLPKSDRKYTGLDLIPNPETKKYRKALSEDPDQHRPQFPIPGFINLAQLILGINIKPHQINFFFSHQCGVAEALNQAQADLKSGKSEHAFIGAADSLIEEDTLEWLMDLNRLKRENFSSGLQPGEAGGFLLLESKAAAKNFSRSPLGLLNAVHTSQEPASFFSGQPPTGRGLTECLKKCLTQSNEIPWIISDQNGEVFRALDWGHAIVRLQETYRNMPEPELWTAPEFFGETGAVAGLISISIVLSHYKWKIQINNSAFILGASDNESRACVQIGATQFN